MLSNLWSIRGFRLLITARFISNIGNGMAPIALAFGVLPLPGATGTSLSYVTASQMIPIVGFLLIGGVMADRFGRARMVGDTISLGRSPLGHLGRRWNFFRCRHFGVATEIFQPFHHWGWPRGICVTTDETGLDGIS